MASCVTPSFGSSTSPQIELIVEETSSTGNTSTLSWHLDYVAHGYAASTSYKKAYTAVIDGETVAEGSYSINGITGTSRIASGTKTIVKSRSARELSFSCSMAFNLYWGSTYGGTKSASGSMSIPGISTSIVTYDANGGTGAPSSQTKWYGTILTLSTVKPSREGHDFLGWSTNATGTVQYNPGDLWGADSDATLYAIWRAHTYIVSYNANGGTGAPGNQTKTYGVVLTLSSTKPTKTNYNFKGWGTSAGSTTVAYSPGEAYTSNAPVTLYAIWELAYTPPRITDLTADRCDSGGILTEEGTYAVVKFNWVTDKSVSSVKIAWKLSSSSSWTSVVVSDTTGTSGSVTKVIGSGSLDTEYNYDIQVTVTDSLGSFQSDRTVFAMKYEMDLLSGGGGVSFGKPASRKGFDVAMTSYFGNLMFDRYETDMGNGLVNYGNGSIDPDMTIEHCILTNNKTPMGGSNHMYVVTYFYNAKTATSNRMQIAYPYNGDGAEYHRYYYGGKWSAWKKHVNEDEFLTAKPIFKLAYMKRSNCHIAASGNDWFTVANSLPAFEGYTLEGIMSYNNGYGDQFLVSYAVYGTKLLAYVKNHHPAELTFSLGCTLLYLRDDLKGQYYSEFTFNPA